MLIDIILLVVLCWKILHTRCDLILGTFSYLKKGIVTFDPPGPPQGPLFKVSPVCTEDMALSAQLESRKNIDSQKQLVCAGDQTCNLIVTF